jgi:hypothetical protein
MDNDIPISEQYRVVAKAWVDADSAATLLEETKSAVLARMMLSCGDMPVSRAEMQVKGSDDWREFVTKMVEAREKAALLKVKLEYIRMKFHEWQSQEASRRAEMRL